MEALAAFITFLAAAITGLFYARLLKSRKLQPKEPQLVPTKSTSRVVHLTKDNLPPSDSIFIGREKEISQLLDWLSPNNRVYLIGVDGVGGVGKTSLVLEVARRCVDAGSFDAIIWVSAVQEILTPDGVLPRESSDTLIDIVRTIAYTLDYQHILQVELSEQLVAVKTILAQHQTLLIVDSLETATDWERVIPFLYELPSPSKCVVTSRERLQFGKFLHLYGFARSESLELISQELKRKEFPAILSEADMLEICDYTGGIPLAIKWIIGLMVSGYTLDSVLRRLKEPDNDIVRFTIEPAIAQLRDKPAHWLLLSLALLPDDSSREQIASVSGLDDELAIEHGLVQLQQLSLINRFDDRFRINPMVRLYLMSTLANYPDFVRKAKERIKA